MNRSIDDCIDDLKSRFHLLDIIVCDDLLPVDLYTRVRHLHQPVFDQDQRIAFVITKDQHDANGPGLMMQQLQAMINDIDISNFFIVLLTTNANAHKDYEIVLQKISKDPVPINIEVCFGSYQKARSQQHLKLKKFAHLSASVDYLKNLSPMQKKLLFDDQAFCMMPWVGLYIGPDNQVRPCCESDLIIGDSSQDTIQHIWNADSQKNLRKKMLQGEMPQSCRSCHEKEQLGRYTLRLSTNEKFIGHAHKIDRTDSHGMLADFDLVYWDVRYNNLCNLACRSCNPTFSSSWHQAAIYLKSADHGNGALKIPGKQKGDIFRQILEHIDSVETIYFAGGEPLMIEEFYQILDRLIELGRTNVHLVYNTNFTRFHLKSWNILDLWQQFDRVSVAASLDGEHARGEYLRQNLVWQDVISNRQSMMQKCSHVDFYISATASICNALHLPDFHRAWVDMGLISADQFNIQMLFDPIWMRVDTAPADIKARIREKYSAHLEWLEPQDSLGRAAYGFRSMLEHIKTDRPFEKKLFWQNISPLDRFYHKDFNAVFPELSSLPRD